MTQQNNRTSRGLFSAACIALALPRSTAFAAEAALGEAEKTGNLVFVYATVALISLLLVAGYLLWEKNKDKKFLLLYLCVAVANCGYLLQAASHSVAGAMTANRISYLGAAYSILMMLLIIMEVCKFPLRKRLTVLLTAITTAAFLLAASGDWLGLYYSHVSIETVNGATRLVKCYGPLHILYPVYLFSYVLGMIGVIAYSIIRKKITTAKHALLLIVSVLGNVGVWFVEQKVDVDFEFLSVSLVLTEVLLLLLYGMLRDYGIAYLRENMQGNVPPAEEHHSQLPQDLEELFSDFAARAETLSAAERRILNYYVEGHEIGDIPELAYISIHTVKKHNRSIYQKLGVASRDDLMLFIELFRRSGRLQELLK